MEGGALGEGGRRGDGDFVVVRIFGERGVGGVDADSDAGEEVEDCHFEVVW